MTRRRDRFDTLGALGVRTAGWIGILPGVFRAITRSRSGRFGLGVIGALCVVALLAPLAPYGPFERVYDAQHELVRLSPPTLNNPFGTTKFGYDVFSQVIWGTQRTLTVGFVAAVVTVLLGANIGLLSGYLGGWVDTLFMRLVDAAYGIPFLPLAIVLIGVFGRSDAMLVIAIAALFWRTTARVVRSQVLSLRHRGYVKAAVVGGASPGRVVYVHIAPNVMSLAVLYGMLLVSESILAEASLSFIGLAPPDSISWGTVLFDAFTSQTMRFAWWWPVFPAACIMVAILAFLLAGRAYEQTLGQPEVKAI